MKRFNVRTEITQELRPWEMSGGRIRAISTIEESADGKYVLYEDAAEAILNADKDNPIRRIEALEKALHLVESGQCPECLQRVRGWKAPVGSFAPEAWATLRERGIDPATGHKKTCKRNKVLGV